jgi:hypothetical protein
MFEGNVFLVGTHPKSNRAGEPAWVVGVGMVSLAMLPKPCPCFHIRFNDGSDNYVAIDDHENYELISEQDIGAGNIPAIKN